MFSKFIAAMILIFLGASPALQAMDSLDEPAFDEEMPRINLNGPVGRGPASAPPTMAEEPKASKSDADIQPAEASRFGVQEFGIIVTEKGFFPNKIVVRRNIPVNLYLTATDSRSLCFVMKKGEYNFHRGVGSKNVEQISFRPTETGPFEFHCPINNIKGNLIVRD